VNWIFKLNVVGFGFLGGLGEKLEILGTSNLLYLDLNPNQKVAAVPITEINNPGSRKISIN